jgi:hypothetical protein
MPSFEAINPAFSGSKTSLLSGFGDIFTAFLISKNTKLLPKNNAFFVLFLRIIQRKTRFSLEICGSNPFQHQHQFWPADLGLVSFDLRGWTSALPDPFRMSQGWQ